MHTSILVVDDDTAILRGVQILLEQSGYTVILATTGQQAIEILSSPPWPALVVLDILLPIYDGFEVCRHIRYLPTHIPILMLSARDEITDKILGLEIGADDYLTKPFEPRELLAHVRALLRFRQQVLGHTEAEVLLQYGPIAMWPVRHYAEVGGQPLELPPKEWALLEMFLRNPKHVLGRETLLRAIWGYDYDGDTRTVDVHVQRLRARLEVYSAAAFIQTVRGFGYRLVQPSDSAIPKK